MVTPRIFTTRLTRSCAGGAGAAAKQQALAEGIQPFHFAPPLDGFLGAALGAHRELAGHHGRNQEGDQRDPILRILHFESSHRRQEVVIKSEHGRRIEATVASSKPHPVEMPKMTSSSVSATVVLLTETTRK